MGLSVNDFKASGLKVSGLRGSRLRISGLRLCTWENPHFEELLYYSFLEASHIIVYGAGITQCLHNA